MPAAARRGPTQDASDTTPRTSQQQKQKKGFATPTKKIKKPDKDQHIDVTLLENPKIFFTFPGMVVGVGAPRSGKTHFGRYLLYQCGHNFKYGLVICPNPVAEDEWDCVPAEFVTQPQSKEQCTQILEAFLKNQEENGFPPAFLIIDDFIGTMDLTHPTAAKLATQFRKYNVFVMLFAQYLAGQVPPVMRQCFKHVYCFQTKSARLLNTLREEYFGPWFASNSMMWGAMARLPKHSAFFLNVEENQLNVVMAPPPDTPELEEFFLTWEKTPEPSEKRDALDGDIMEPHKKGQLPEQWARLEEAEAKRNQWEKDNLEAPDVKGAKPYPAVTQETRQAAHNTLKEKKDLQNLGWIPQPPVPDQSKPYQASPNKTLQQLQQENIPPKTQAFLGSNMGTPRGSPEKVGPTRSPLRPVNIPSFTSGSKRLATNWKPV